MELFIFARFHVRAGMEGEASVVLRGQVRHVRNEAGRRSRRMIRHETFCYANGEFYRSSI
jgi:hypothetical protein